MGEYLSSFPLSKTSVTSTLRLCTDITSWNKA